MLVGKRDVAAERDCSSTSSVIQLIHLIASKLIAYHQRRGKPKAGTDWRDLAMLRLQFPELNVRSGEVLNKLRQLNVQDSVIELWQEMVAIALEPEGDDDDF